MNSNKDQQVHHMSKVYTYGVSSLEGTQPTPLADQRGPNPRAAVTGMPLRHAAVHDNQPYRKDRAVLQDLCR